MKSIFLKIRSCFYDVAWRHSEDIFPFGEEYRNCENFQMNFYRLNNAYFLIFHLAQWTQSYLETERIS